MTHTIKPGEPILFIEPALGPSALKGISSANPRSPLRILFPSQIRDCLPCRKYFKAIHEMRRDGRDIQIRYADEFPATHGCAVAGGKIFPRPEEVQSCDLMANGFMLDVGAGEDEQKAIEIAEDLWGG